MKLPVTGLLILQLFHLYKHFNRCSKDKRCYKKGCKHAQEHSRN